MVCIEAEPGVRPLVAKLSTLFCQKPHVALLISVFSTGAFYPPLLLVA
jgi:hypothetical protein